MNKNKVFFIIFAVALSVMLMADATTEVATGQESGWAAVAFLVIKMVASLMTLWYGHKGGMWITTKQEKEELEKELTEEQMEDYAKEKFNDFIYKALCYSYQTVVKPGKAEGKSLAVDTDFMEEAHTAYINFARKQADKYNVGDFVSKLEDDDLIDILRSTLGALKHLTKKL